MAAQAARRAVRQVAQLGHGLLHAGSGLGVDLLGLVQRARDGGARHTGQSGDIAGVGAADLGCLGFVLHGWMIATKSISSVRRELCRDTG